MNKERIRSLPKAVRKEFPPFSPDFAVEVKSQSDRRRQHEKCREYIANGTLEVWLIDPEKQTVHVYSADGGVTEFKDCLSVTSRYLPSFTMDLRPLWQGLDI
ncbi:MAG: Uma2 family endonuclease [Acidobacteriota bacterium]|nr:Uma2 family endonuclease [Acidobacteriota bacterium]